MGSARGGVPGFTATTWAVKVSLAVRQPVSFWTIAPSLAAAFNRNIRLVPLTNSQILPSIHKEIGAAAPSRPRTVSESRVSRRSSECPRYRMRMSRRSISRGNSGLSD
jgi:hypothetical protein